MSKHVCRRRAFLKTGVTTLATLAFLRSPGLGSAASQAEEPFPELRELTIANLQERMKSGAWTARQITQMYLERIRGLDGKTNAVIEINPDALAIADRLDRERRGGRVRSPLHGIPILIKDNLDTADQMLTTAGSLALLDAPRPKRDAFAARQLRQAGAVILGKTNLSEWANFRGHKSISGWSGRGGQTNNPYFLDQNPCGSSSGSGVAVSANLCAAAVGTETNGSIICPAVTNGVVGLKPTVGLISRSGIIPIAATQDTAGPMTRTVADAALLLGAMTGRDPRDPATAGADGKGLKDYARFLAADGLNGARLGVVMQFTQNPELKTYCQAFLEVLRAAGATLVEVTFRPDYGKLSPDQTAVLLYEFKTGLNQYLAARGAKYRTLADLIRFNEEYKVLEMPKFGQELFLEAEKKGGLAESAYTDALARIKKATREEGIDALLGQEKLDALVGPTTGQLWSIAAMAGYPSLTVPLGLRESRATGMLFVGKPYSEGSLIQYAFAIEQKTKARVVPQLLPRYPGKG